MSECFDRLRATQLAYGVTLITRPVQPDHQPVTALSTRGPRFVGHAVCPMCGTDGQGVEYQGELMSGVKVHTVAAHAAGMRRADRGKPRCLGAGMKVVLEGGAWKGAPAP